ncbi:MAG TPA: nucleoside deaminase [Bacteroidales bacterium]|nr:nucleoside deaminase [Bacteroidales bacterium]HRS18761.1 nucleoside deaminase [Bacteroidales bacterium]
MSLTEQHSHEYFMKQALQQANIALQKDEVPVGAVIVYNNQIIARAHNLTETLNDPTAHAEMQAFTSATEYLGGKYLQKATLYVTLEPCAMCGGASYWVQIGTIVYGASDNKRGISALRSHILHPKTQIIGGILQTECETLLQNFFKQKR